LLYLIGFCLAIILGVQTVGAETYKQLPPAGIQLPPDIIEKIQTQTQAVREDLNLAKAKHLDVDQWQADVEVFVRAVELALEQNLFYKAKDADAALRALQVARDRLVAVEQGERDMALLKIGSGAQSSGRTFVGGFVSSIDGSVQPYGLVMPDSAHSETAAEKVSDPDGAKHPEGRSGHRGQTPFPKTQEVAGHTVPMRMDVWLHGRGDTNTEIPFLLERLDKLGQYSPPGVCVLHPFGRHCNAYKFAGEVDVYEAMRHVQKLLPIDSDRISIRGFSMGGAGVWHLAAHDPGRWFAANPGAGFVDTVQYQGWTEGFPYEPGPWGRKLMAWYDVPPIVDNLSNTQVIAYSGELDKQRASAEIMVAAAQSSSLLRQRGFEIKQVIGKDMGHKIDADSAALIDAELAKLAALASDQPRLQLHLTTPTLRYHEVDWLSIQGLEEHWKYASIDAEIQNSATIRISTKNVNAFRLDFSKHGWPVGSGYLRLIIDGENLDGPTVIQGEPLITHWAKVDQKWEEFDSDPQGMVKRPGLQGPIDDAFTSSFLFVLPSRPCRHGEVERFVDREIAFARERWRQIMRGNDRVVMDHELTPEQIATCNLVCFGDFSSNRYLATLAPALPIQWNDEQIVVGEKSFDASTHAALLVYPNPQAPDRYIVANSGITFRESSNSTNSRQIAMLPDWVVLDVTEPADGVFAGRIAAAGFFDEAWKLKSPE
jgi:pimeloyl-ACP methyl ester carboxylesterase